jgi:Trypsin
MQSIPVQRARAFVVAVGLIVAALAYLDAHSFAAGQATAVGSARSSEASEVEAAVFRTNLAGKLEAGLGGAFGGVWFDPSSAQLHVGVTSSESRREAEAVAAEAGLAEHVAETPVRSTWAQLEAAQERWSQRLADLFQRAEVKTSLSADTNSLEVDLDPTVPASRGAALERAAAADSVDVSINAAAAHLPTRVLERCNKLTEKFKAYCNPTIVGGVSIDDEVENEGKGDCTAGPAVVKAKPTTKEAATESFILTAGHCIHLTGGNNKKWFAFNQAKERKEIGKSVDYIFGVGISTDIGVIKVETSYWATAGAAVPVVPTVAQWSKEKETDPTEVKAEGELVEETKACFSGQRSGTQCGTIKKVNTEEVVKWEEGKEVKETTLKNLAEVKVETGKVGQGDSGSPYFSEATKSTVLGVLVAGQINAETGEGEVAFFHPLKTAFEKLKNEKALDLELLKEGNKNRHAKLKAGKFPVTIHGSAGGVEKFTTEAGTIECKAATYHAVAEESSSTLTVTPEYKECSAFGLSATVSTEGCTYVFHVLKKVSADNYRANVDISCPEGKSIKFVAGTCKLETKSQNGLERDDLIDDTSASPKKDITVRPTIAGITYTVTQDGIGCPFNGTGTKTDGEYTSTENITATGQSTTEASEKIDIEVADE